MQSVTNLGPLRDNPRLIFEESLSLLPKTAERGNMGGQLPGQVQVFVTFGFLCECVRARRGLARWGERG
jgi:hypothetical protein